MVLILKRKGKTLDNQTKRPLFTRNTKPVSHQFAASLLVLKVSILLGFCFVLCMWGPPVIPALGEVETGGPQSKPASVAGQNRKFWVQEEPLPQ